MIRGISRPETCFDRLSMTFVYFGRGLFIDATANTREVRPYKFLNNSFTEVFERVFSSTFFTIIAA